MLIYQALFCFNAVIKYDNILNFPLNLPDPENVVQHNTDEEGG